MNPVKIFLLVITLISSCTQVKQADNNIALPPNTNEQEVIFKFDVKNREAGLYSDQQLLEDIGTIQGIRTKGRASIVIDKMRGNVLRAFYPEGGIGPEQTGIQFVKPLPPADEYYLDYYMKFEQGFDFVKGGKLPGLTSGGSLYTGGRHPNDGQGWSTRYMWIEDGEIIIYFYHVDMQHKWGDTVKMNVKFKRGQWYRITQRIKLNSNRDFNGVMQAWVDGNKVLDHSDVRYRFAPLGNIDTFYFSSFHGGNTLAWAPSADSSILFDQFIVSSTRPADLD
ncbi:MAG: polysaccharide lyase [Kangiellaceae bacterium]|nr:polysaccharide lyase [Kangiellaceae bacterium]